MRISDWSSDVCSSDLLAADLVDRLLPGDLRPLAVHQLGRMLQAALTVRMLADRRALGAMGAEVDRAVPAGLLPDPDAVLHLGHPRAARRAVRAHDRTSVV